MTPAGIEKKQLSLFFLYWLSFSHHKPQSGKNLYEAAKNGKKNQLNDEQTLSDLFYQLVVIYTLRIL